jgi:hypothetical protein
LEAITPLLALKLIDTAPGENVTEAGTLSAAEELDSETVVVAGADLDTVTVQDVLPFDVKVVAAHWTAETRTGETSATEAVFEDPLRVAVIVAV